eukprot:5149876-Prymnesium_polylepis.1
MGRVRIPRRCPKAVPAPNRKTSATPVSVLGMMRARPSGRLYCRSVCGEISFAKVIRGSTSPSLAISDWAPKKPYTPCCTALRHTGRTPHVRAAACPGDSGDWAHLIRGPIHAGFEIEVQ